MSALALIDAVAQKTGEDSHEIRRRGFMLAGPEDSGSGLDSECMLDLIDLAETGKVDWANHCARTSARASRSSNSSSDMAL
jgi:hypothetical protein